MNLPFKVPEAKDQRSEKTLELKLTTVTPILGGGVFARELDDCEVIRVPSIRGQLRFWWRAQCDGPVTPSDLKEKETALWGGLGTGNQTTATRSRIRISVNITKNTCKRSKNHVHPKDEDFYALWPARGSDAKTWNPGIQFELKVTYPKKSESEIRRALSAWLCFGGYGSRTRRGVGKIAPNCQLSRELVPAKPNEPELKRLFGDCIFASPNELSDWPRLRGMQLAVGKPHNIPRSAWLQSLKWLEDFRQGQPANGALGGHSQDYARVRGVGNRPSISNWPEADKVRQLNQGKWSHAPRHNATSVLPRATFGLPIISTYQRSARDKTTLNEPNDYNIQWIDEQNKIHDRLASPLLIGCLPLTDEKFVPFACWLARGYPGTGKVCIQQNNRELPGSRADFDQLVAVGDDALFQPLRIGQKAENGYRMRTAFFAWLQERSNVQLFGSSEVSS